MATSALLATEESLQRMIRWRSTPSGVMQAVVMHALQLQRASRETFILCDIQGCSITETASILGINPEVVIRRLKRARRHMDDVVTRLCEQHTHRESVSESC
jgi:DNA-directed RNA polymerase specialized sigma24 family protein